MQILHVIHAAPSHGWLRLAVTAEGKTIEIDGSDVPNNPVQELIAALDLAAMGSDALVWWNLEPDGYFMHFIPKAGKVVLRIDHAVNSQRSRSATVLSVSGTSEQILLPFWRFVREFQSHNFQEPHWPPVEFGRLPAIKGNIGVPREVSQETPPK